MTAKGPRIAVMSDAHANPAALRAALQDARALGCDRRLFLGDVTGYGYDVKSTLELVRANFDVALLGNHDSVLLGREPPLDVMMCPNYDVDVQERKELNPDEKAWLGGLGFIHREADAIFVHGDATDPKDWRYILDPYMRAANFAILQKENAHVLFCGHTHHAEAWACTAKGRVKGLRARTFAHPAKKAQSTVLSLSSDCRYIVNVGSVGNPRNDLCIVYAIYEPEAGRVTIRRLPFDFKGYAEEMRRHQVSFPYWLEREGR